MCEFDWNVTEVFSEGPINKGLTPSRLKAIIWINDTYMCHLALKS